MPSATMAAHSAWSGTFSSVPSTSGRAATDSRTRPRETHPGIRSQRSDHTRPGQAARAPAASLESGAQKPYSALR